MVEAKEARQIGDPDPRIVRFQRKRKLIIAVIVLVIAASSIFYFSGSYDRWQESRSLTDTCRNSVDTSEVKELLGVDRLRGRNIEVEQGSNPSAGQLHKCSVRDPDGAAYLSVALDWGSDVGGVLHEFGGFSPYEDGGMAIPLGHGWEGVMAEGGLGSDLIATVNMPCANRRTDPERSSLVVTVESMAEQAKGGTVQRARFARTAVKTAQNAAKAWGCTAHPGGAVARVPGNAAHAEVPSGEARGTCEGITTAVRESATDPKAPIENCYLLSDSDTSQYRISAFYSPFAKAVPEQLSYTDVLDPGKLAGHKGSGYWASAKCPSGSRALYITTGLPDTEDRFDSKGTLQKSALKAFATRSAKRHGCTDLKLP
ncbi:hypothetical protein [Streptomyces tubercidicus]|uniref:hypothetical protein n=1 Tax=Streptomyces tubercidicus TaxID=47759 RepID=UPI002E127CB1|nr:hypothetical protein OG761_29545 [Streptomyces tubercidicus]WSX19733.1 hypothetical protein OG690_07845 [Streptomyces tubercidicus]